MANGYYNPTGHPFTKGDLSSSDIREEFVKLGQAFDNVVDGTGTPNSLVVINPAGNGTTTIPGSDATLLANGNNADSQHKHAYANILGLVAALNNKANVGHAHQHNDNTDRDASGCHPIAAIDNLQAFLDGKANTSHIHTHNSTSGRDVADSHPIEAITGLQDALDTGTLQNPDITGRYKINARDMVATISSVDTFASGSNDTEIKGHDFVKLTSGWGTHISSIMYRTEGPSVPDFQATVDHVNLGAGRRFKTLFCTDPVNVSSDERLKNIEPIGDCDWILDLKPIAFRMKDDTSGLRYGFTAQHTYEVMPNKDAVLVTKPDNPMDKWGMAYDELIPVMLEKIIQMEARIKDLEAK